MVSIEAIEEIKENLLPVAAGRSISGLLSYDARVEAEMRAQIDGDDGPWTKLDDPLEVHLKFIDYIRQYKAPPVEVLELTAARFDTWANYKNDIRYVRLWIEYASTSQEPLEFFAYMNHQEIGVGYALFYEEWAAVYELSGLVERAHDVLQRGMNHKAWPLARLGGSLDELEARHPSKFRKRLRSDVANAGVTTQNTKRLKIFCDNGNPPQEVPEPSQVRFPSSLFCQGIENKPISVRNWQDAPRIPSQAPPISSAQPLVIFKDDLSASLSAPIGPNLSPAASTSRNIGSTLEPGYDVTLEERMLQLRGFTHEDRYNRRLYPEKAMVITPKSHHSNTLLAEFHYNNLHVGVTEAISQFTSECITEQL